MPTHDNSQCLSAQRAQSRDHAKRYSWAHVPLHSATLLRGGSAARGVRRSKQEQGQEQEQGQGQEQGPARALPVQTVNQSRNKLKIFWVPSHAVAPPIARIVVEQKT